MLADVIIIGGGINGLISAFVLAREGIKVSILERGPGAIEASWAGAGILSPLLPWDYDHAVNTLSEIGRNSWPYFASLAKELSGFDPEYTECGMYVCNPDNNEKAEEWCAQYNWHLHKLPLQTITSCGSDRNTGFWLPRIAQIRNPKLIHAFIASCRAMGVLINFNTEVTSLLARSDRIDSISTSQGNMAAGAYVLCAGAWSNAFHQTIQTRLDIEPVRGQILLFRGKPGLLPCIVYKDGMYIVPRNDGHILVGSTIEFVGYDKFTTTDAKDTLTNFFRSNFPGLSTTKFIRQWAGLRPGSPGNIPTISIHPTISNLFVNSGHYRYGVTMAPASSNLLRDIMLGQSPSIPCEPYRWRVEEELRTQTG